MVGAGGAIAPLVTARHPVSQPASGLHFLGLPARGQEIEVNRIVGNRRLVLRVNPGEVTFLPIAQGIVEVPRASPDLARKRGVVLAGVTQELRKLVRNRAGVPPKGAVKGAPGMGIVSVGNRLSGV